MSKQPERTEKDCLNCGEILNGRFCHNCGQENIVWKQNFISLVKHFIYDLFHFDGKFFDTLKNLFISPGLVPKEYINGKRAKYLDPIRMYLFTSAIFFIIFFSISKNGNLFNITDSSKVTNEDRLKIAAKYEERFIKGGSKDSFLIAKSALLRDTMRPFSAAEMLAPQISFGNRDYHSLHEYDSIQKTLPFEERDKWLLSAIRRKMFDINEKYKGDIQSMGRKFLNDFIHKFPYMLFLSLPFFAGILKLLYIRRKNFFYSDHAIFTIYHFIISFILLLFLIAFKSLQNWLEWGVFNFFIFVTIVWWFIYLYKSMRRFYEQRRGKTLLKYFLLNLTGFILFNLLFFIILIISVLQL
ncbi:MAG: DUF3667 domain-containing protein [Bacteroidota bacterium]|nr:DUF3667 domain-containing protein [Bacteroidota bacterium]